MLRGRLRRSAFVTVVGLCALGCKTEEPWDDEVATPRLETIEPGTIQLQWNGELGPTPSTWEEITRDALHPVLDRDDEGIPSRFVPVLDVVDKAGLTDVSELSWYAGRGQSPSRFGSSPAGGFWAPKRDPELWVVDARGKLAPTRSLRERIHPALVVHPKVLDLLDEPEEGDVSRAIFTDFVRESFVNEDADTIPRSSWLRWARWAQMKGDAESATAILVHYESAVNASCESRCNESEDGEHVTPVRCDLLEHARADIGLHLERAVSRELEEDWLSWEEALARLRTAAAIYPEASPTSERLLRIVAIERYLEWRIQFEYLWSNGLDKLEPNERALALVALIPENAPRLRGPKDMCCYDLSAELRRLPVEVLPAMEWYFSLGASLPQRGGGIDLVNSGGSRIGRYATMGPTGGISTNIMWRICALADATWLPERAPKICGNEVRRCSIEVILERLDMSGGSPVPPRDGKKDPMFVRSGWKGPASDGMPNRDLEAPVLCETHTHEPEVRTRLLAPECFARGLRDPRHRYGRSAGHFARLVARSGGFTREQEYRGKHAGVDLGTWTRYLADEAVDYAKAPSGSPMVGRWLESGHETLSAMRHSEGLGELDVCAPILDGLETPIGWLDLIGLEQASVPSMASWHEAHLPVFDELVVEVQCEAHVKLTGLKRHSDKGEVRRRTREFNLLRDLRWERDTLPPGSLMLGALMSLPGDTRLRPLEPEEYAPWVESVEQAYVKTFAQPVPSFPETSEARDEVCLLPLG